MKKICFVLSLLLLISWLSYCAPTAVVTSGGQQTIAEAQSEQYDGPKARLAVGEFQDKTAKGGWEGGWLGMFGESFKENGAGMRDMLTTSLFNSNRFIV